MCPNFVTVELFLYLCDTVVRDALHTQDEIRLTLEQVLIFFKPFCISRGIVHLSVPVIAVFVEDLPREELLYCYNLLFPCPLVLPFRLVGIAEGTVADETQDPVFVVPVRYDKIFGECVVDCILFLLTRPILFLLLLLGLPIPLYFSSYFKVQVVFLRSGLRDHRVYSVRMQLMQNIGLVQFRYKPTGFVAPMQCESNPILEENAAVHRVEEPRFWSSRGIYNQGFIIKLVCRGYYLADGPAIRYKRFIHLVRFRPVYISKVPVKHINLTHIVDPPGNPVNQVPQTHKLIPFYFLERRSDQRLESAFLLHIRSTEYIRIFISQNFPDWHAVVHREVKVIETDFTLPLFALGYVYEYRYFRKRKEDDAVHPVPFQSLRHLWAAFLEDVLGLRYAGKFP